MVQARRRPSSRQVTNHRASSHHLEEDSHDLQNGTSTHQKDQCEDPVLADREFELVLARSPWLALLVGVLFGELGVCQLLFFGLQSLGLVWEIGRSKGNVEVSLPKRAVFDTFWESPSTNQAIFQPFWDQIMVVEWRVCGITVPKRKIKCPKQPGCYHLGKILIANFGTGTPSDATSRWNTYHLGC